MLHLRLELWERGLIGDEDRLGMIKEREGGARRRVKEINLFYLFFSCGDDIHQVSRRHSATPLRDQPVDQQRDSGRSFWRNFTEFPGESRHLC